MGITWTHNISAKQKCSNNLDHFLSATTETWTNVKSSLQQLVISHIFEKVELSCYLYFVLLEMSQFYHGPDPFRKTLSYSGMSYVDVQLFFPSKLCNVWEINHILPIRRFEATEASRILKTISATDMRIAFYNCIKTLSSQI